MGEATSGTVHSSNQNRVEKVRRQRILHMQTMNNVSRLTHQGIFRFIFVQGLFIFILCTSAYVGTLYGVVSSESRRGCLIPWTWRYRHRPTMRGAGSESGPLEEQVVPLNPELALQLLFLSCLSDRYRPTFKRKLTEMRPDGNSVLSSCWLQ